MKDHEVKALLQETLEDYQLTKKERNELRDLLDNVRGDEQRRALYRSMAFDAAREALAKADAGQRFQVLDWLEGTVKTLHPTENLPAGGKREGAKSYFSPDDNCVGKITEMFGTAWIHQIWARHGTGHPCPSDIPAINGGLGTQELSSFLGTEQVDN